MDSSSRVELPLLAQDNTVTFMDPKLYKAAAEGQIDPFNAYTEPLNLLLTPTRNTILHVYITQQPKGADISIPFMEQILAKCPSLLLQTNNRGETLLHMSARHGHPDIVRCLIDWANTQHQDIETGAGAAKAMLRMENVDKETALHEAVRHDNPITLGVLVEEDPDFSHSVNGLGETPIYLAVEREYTEMVFKILDTCTLPAFDGPNGRTALHEAVIRNNSEITAKILGANKTLVKQVDQQGWTPLHQASHLGHLSIVKLLLECDTSAAYIGDKHGMTPLHIAAARGDKGEKVVFLILENCPDCHELVDHKGRNVLHYAVLSGGQSTADHLSKGPKNKDHNYRPLLTNLINQKDVDGNTPLHLLATCCLYSVTLIKHPFADKVAVNNDNFTPLDIISKSTDNHIEGSKGVTLGTMKDSGYKQSQRNWFRVRDLPPQVIDIERIQRTKTSHIIVAALIATVTFTAGFTIPGGYNDKEGTAIMSGNGAFVTFVITDALALLLSTCALFFYYASDFQDMLTNRSKEHLIFFAGLFIMVSIFLMFIAFTTAVFAVVQSTYLKALICVISSFSFLICYYPLKHLM